LQCFADAQGTLEIKIHYDGPTELISLEYEPVNEASHDGTTTILSRYCKDGKLNMPVPPNVADQEKARASEHLDGKVREKGRDLKKDYCCVAGMCDHAYMH
jgi:hypothetical protein